ncbi:MAG: ABC transporter substrate-binding protein [Lachnoclostridium sp.]|nr:ABC transporter substrate-binding protein [Lachnoclostridium sp.]
MKRKILSVLICLTMVFALAACGSSEPASTDDSSTEETKELIKVGFAQCKADESDWRKANTTSMQEALSEDAGFELILDDANNDPTKQVNAVKGFIDQEVDYIVIAAVNMDGWDTVLNDAKTAGIPVILVDRTINASEDLYTCWVGSDFKGEGVKATDWMKERFGDEEVKVVNLQGQLGSSAQVGRTEALQEAVEANDKWELVNQQTGNWNTDEAKEIMASWIQQNKDINCVYAENDNMADGAIQALEEEGIAVGGDDGVAVISFDANRAYLQMTLEGKINCNVECNPLHGPRVAELINTLESGGQPAKQEFVEEEAFFYDSITQEVIDARQY